MDDKAEQATLERQARLTGLVWPKGMPTRDKVVLEAIPIEERNRILDRLEAVWSIGRGEPLSALADLAGLKRAAFYNLRKGWERNSLSGIVPHDSRSSRRVDADDDDPLRKRAAELLRADPVRRNVDLAKLIMDESGVLGGEVIGPRDALAGLQRLERLVRDERRQLAKDPVFLANAYGAGLVLDLTAVALVIGGDAPSLAVAAILMETASGLVLGSALGRMGDGVALQRDALVRGLEFLKRHRADVVPSRVAAPDLGLMLPPDVNADRAAEMLAPYVDDLTVGRIGGFGFGQQSVQIIGPRMGRIALTPRRTLAFNVDQFLEKRAAPIMPLEGARAHWVREVERHNVDRLDALSKAGILDNCLGDGRLAAVMRALLSALQPA